MPRTNHELIWKSIGFCQQGANHSRSGAVCQDAIHWLPENGVGPPIVLSVADGHGESKYFRSGIGAQLAVLSAESVMSKLLNDVRKHEHLYAIPQINRYIENDLGRDIHKQWTQAVRQHIHETPLCDSEFDQLNNQISKQNNIDRLFLSDDELIPVYGSTLLSVLVTNSFIIYLQLGDGDILTISADGNVERPFEIKKELGDATDSLSQLQNLRFQVGLQVMEESITPPSMILLATDGFSKSYESDDDFYKFGTNIFNMLLEAPFDVGFKNIGRDLPGWLHEVTTHGSGDDVSVGMLFHASFFTSNMNLDIKK